METSIKQLQAGATTVVETVYHQVRGEKATAQATRYQRPAATDAQPYKRRVKLTEQWVELDRGWLDATSMVVVSNLEGVGLTRVPTPEETKAIEARVVEVAIDGTVASFIIPPKESMRGCPAGKVFARCRRGTARALVTFYPL